MIRVRNLQYHIRGRYLVDRVNLEVHPGEVVALVGANGAGKSTLLRLLAGELRPTGGSVTLDNQPLERYGARGLARRRAVLPQSLASAPGLTVEETVSLGRSPHFGTAAAAEDRVVVAEVLRSGGLHHWAQRSLDSLSGGEVQRVHLARGLAQLTSRETGSRYYFLDEPTSALDLGRQIETLTQIGTLARQGLGVVVVVHDLNLAARFADRIAVLSEGRLEAWGPPGEVLSPEVIARAFSTDVVVIPHPVLGHPLVLPLYPLVS